MVKGCRLGSAILPSGGEQHRQETEDDNWQAAEFHLFANPIAR
jgi:hypothetical protein